MTDVEIFDLTLTKQQMIDILDTFHDSAQMQLTKTQALKTLEVWGLLHDALKWGANDTVIRDAIFSKSRNMTGIPSEDTTENERKHCTRLHELGFPVTEAHRSIYGLSKQYRIWSNEHNAFWRPKSIGYTTDIDQAGVYTQEQAMKICVDANAHLSPSDEPNEIMIDIDLRDEMA